MALAEHAHSFENFHFQWVPSPTRRTRLLPSIPIFDFPKFSKIFCDMLKMSMAVLNPKLTWSPNFHVAAAISCGLTWFFDSVALVKGLRARADRPRARVRCPSHAGRLAQANGAKFWVGSRSLSGRVGQRYVAWEGFGANRRSKIDHLPYVAERQFARFQAWGRKKPRRLFSGVPRC